MNSQVQSIVNLMENLLAADDADTAWNMEGEFAKIWNEQAPNSPEQKAMAAVWKKMMQKWH